MSTVTVRSSVPNTSGAVGVSDAIRADATAVRVRWRRSPAIVWPISAPPADATRAGAADVIISRRAAFADAAAFSVSDSCGAGRRRGTVIPSASRWKSTGTIAGTTRSDAIAHPADATANGPHVRPNAMRTMLRVDRPGTTTTATTATFSTIASARNNTRTRVRTGERIGRRKKR